MRPLLLLIVIVAACSSNAAVQATEPNVTTVEPAVVESTSSIVPTTTKTTVTVTTVATTIDAPNKSDDERDPLSRPRPVWLGTRLLPLRPGEDNGVAQPTPVELIDRRLWTIDVLIPPDSDAFASSISVPPPPSVVARSTWREECPVALDDLGYATVSFVGFDGLFHTGEFIVHRDAVEGVVEIFRQLHAQRFPIEEMIVTTQADVDADPTGDSNNTSSFVCRPAVNSGRWSRHAHGGAIDINPFHNPYLKGDLVIPELASAYLDRGRDVPGLVTADIEAMFRDLGWGWGGNWKSASDWMHFSDTGN